MQPWKFDVTDIQIDDSKRVAAHWGDYDLGDYWKQFLLNENNNIWDSCFCPQTMLTASLCGIRCGLVKKEWQRGLVGSWVQDQNSCAPVAQMSSFPEWFHFSELGERSSDKLLYLN